MLQAGYTSLLKRVQSVQTNVLSTGERNSLLRVFEKVIPSTREAIIQMNKIDLEKELNQVLQMVENSGSIIGHVKQEVLESEEGRMKEFVERLSLFNEGCRKFEESGHRITEIDDEIDEAIVNDVNPAIRRELPEVIEQLTKNYEIAREAAEPHRKSFESFALQQKSEIHTLRLAKDREVKVLLDSVQMVSNYPRGWAGFKLRVRDWRLAEQNKWKQRKIGGVTWGVILVALGVFVVWPAWLVHRAGQNKGEARFSSVER